MQKNRYVHKTISIACSNFRVHLSNKYYQCIHWISTEEKCLTHPKTSVRMHRKHWNIEIICMYILDITKQENGKLRTATKEGTHWQLYRTAWSGFSAERFCLENVPTWLTLALDNNLNTIHEVQEPDVLLYTMLEIYPKAYSSFLVGTHSNKANTAEIKLASNATKNTFCSTVLIYPDAPQSFYLSLCRPKWSINASKN